MTKHPRLGARWLMGLLPRNPGTGTPLRWTHAGSLLYRVPVAVGFGVLAMHPDTSPYNVQASMGPSMLPTIRFVGDLWLVETGAWSRLLERFLSSVVTGGSTNGGEDRGFPWWSFGRRLRKGDVVLWEDPSTGRVSCKRIVGLPGDEVLRYGEYARLYSHRKDWGIVWPSNAGGSSSSLLDPSCPWDDGRHAGTEGDAASPNAEEPETGREIARTFRVPPGTIWVEGDAPPFSLDSRHYGPIPVPWVRGRLLLRVWPFSREDERTGEPISNGWLGQDRPRPFRNADDYLGKAYNFHRLPRATPGARS